MYRPVTIGSPTLPTNSAYSIIFDSTRGLVETYTLSATLYAPGTLRGMFAGRRCHGTIAPIAQDVTVKFYRNIAPATLTNAAWAVDPDAPDSGSIAVTAGNTYSWNWMPTAADFLAVVLAGATAPSALTGHTVIERQRTSGR